MSESYRDAAPESEIDIAQFMTDLHRQVAARPNVLRFQVARKPGIAWINALKRARRQRGSNGMNGQVQVNVSLNALLRLDDSEFIRKAYIRLLGRRADPAGYAIHLALLHGRRSDRIRVLEILSQCPEGLARNAHVRGLKRAILWHRLFSFDATIWEMLRYDATDFVDVIYAQLLRREPDPAGYAHRVIEARRGRSHKISILAELVASAEGREKRLRIRGLLLARIFNKLFRYDVGFNDIMRYDGATFVDHVYAELLHREPDPAGYAHRVSEVRWGRSNKIRVLAEIVASPEGRKKRLRVRGLLLARIFNRLFRYDLRLGDLLRYDGADFVDHVYADLLRREPDAAGYAGHVAEARFGRRGKINILAGVVGSQEGHEKRLRVRGLLFAVLRQNLYETLAPVARRARTLIGNGAPSRIAAAQAQESTPLTALAGSALLASQTDSSSTQPGLGVVEAERLQA